MASDGVVASTMKVQAWSEEYPGQGVWAQLVKDLKRQVLWVELCPPKRCCGPNA